MTRISYPISLLDWHWRGRHCSKSVHQCIWWLKQQAGLIYLCECAHFNFLCKMVIVDMVKMNASSDVSSFESCGRGHTGLDGTEINLLWNEFLSELYCSAVLKWNVLIFIVWKCKFVINTTLDSKATWCCGTENVKCLVHAHACKSNYFVHLSNWLFHPQCLSVLEFYGETVICLHHSLCSGMLYWYRALS